MLTPSFRKDFSTQRREKITLEQVAGVLWHQSCISLSSSQFLLPSSGFQVTNRNKKKIHTNFILRPKNPASLSFKVGWKKWKYKGNEVCSHLENVYLDNFFSLPLSRHIYQVEDVSLDKLDVIPTGNIRMSVKIFALASAWGHVCKGMLTLGIWDLGDLTQLQRQRT